LRFELAGLILRMRNAEATCPGVSVVGIRYSPFSSRKRANAL
jgi:hypothetical protein